MLIVRDSQVKKLFYKEQEIDKILDWNGNVVFEKESAPTTTKYIKFTTSPSVASANVFTVTYTDSTQDTLSYSEPSKEYTLSIPTDKIVKTIDFDNTIVDEVKVSCKINLSNTFFTKKPKTIRILNCDATSSTSMNSLFSYSSSVRTIVMNDLDVRNVTDMSRMFYRCSGAKTIDIANWNTSSANQFKNVFDSCENVAYIDLSSWDTSNAITMYEMFQNCTSLVMIDLSAFNTSKVTDFRYMFWECNKLTSLDISGWDMTNAKYTSCMFCGCNSLKTIRMVGCNQTTIDKIKSEKPSNATIITE